MSEKQVELSARMSDDKTRCEIVVSTPEGVCTIRMGREHTFRLGQTLLIMSATMLEDEGKVKP